MNAMNNSPMLWVVLAVMVALTALALEHLFQVLFTRYDREQQRYPHRVGNQLPRTLSKSEHEEAANRHQR